jgi:hypothetical protein
MDPETPTTQPAVSQPSSTTQPLQHSTSHMFQAVFWIIFMLMIVEAGGMVYLASQNNKLSIEIASLKTAQEVSQGALMPTTMPTQPTASTPTPIPGWKSYSIPLINAAFQYPPNLVVSTDIKNSTALAADKEYWVAASGSDVLYLDAFLYKSNKTAVDWWNTEGKAKFEKLADEIAQAMSPMASINLTYGTKSTTFAGKPALEVTVSSNYGSPQTPSQRFLTIVQQNGYIMMISYHDQGTTASSIEISKQILSTFTATN